ncbi:MAG: DUF4255 domain-containing protein [Prolixibacteraceae bacterium]|jgi:hypothetical protein|nr:DUF4255 domain-containing protein [Prolixibacteraceae bacterium]MBT6764268.1 DUF4255 domain-containing protein [Prolixibacteraceae bacterium]MBT6996981.1 DUF4255 domain-containing protein [Prolixibacteraceae bacterium]MBT7394239.1 DUF4255 domain-containing protein [Prolixibacteraceae bacterium]
MIYEALQILKEQLDTYFEKVGLGKIIALENIALWESGSEEANKVDGKVVLTLLNIEAETTLKNAPVAQVVNNKTEYRNPPVHLNFFLLVSANCDTYDKSLRSISKTIEFFQGKSVFTSANTIYNRTNVAFDVLDYFKFVLNIYTPSFEVLNHVWGTLGGRQLPSAIYKVQLIQIERDKKLSSSEVITHVSGKLNHID